MIRLLAFSMLIAVGIACAAEPFPRPVDHETLKSAIAAADADLVVVNVWATWCIPCRVEFPHFVKLRQDWRDKGVEVYFVSADFPDEVEATRKFLKKQKVDWLTFIKDGKDAPFIEALHPKWSGALPATFVFDRTGKLLDWWEQAVEYDELEEKVKNLLPKQ